jgi:hypothetical protein
VFNIKHMERKFENIEQIRDCYCYETGQSYPRLLSIVYGSVSPKLPERPTKPSTKIATSKEAAELAKSLKVYEDNLEKYEIAKKAYYAERGRLTLLLDEFVKDESGINEIPEQYREKVWSYLFNKYDRADLLYEATEIVERIF